MYFNHLLIYKIICLIYTYIVFDYFTHMDKTFVFNMPKNTQIITFCFTTYTNVVRSICWI